MTFEEADAAVTTLTRDLAKLLVVRRMSHYINQRLDEQTKRAIEGDVNRYVEDLKQRNHVFADLPRLFVSFEGMSIVLRWAGDLS